jgi:hypothetical protein
MVCMKKQQFIKEKNVDVPKHINDAGSFTSHESGLEPSCDLRNKGRQFRTWQIISFLQIMYRSKLLDNY